MRGCIEQEKVRFKIIAWDTSVFFMWDENSVNKKLTFKELFKSDLREQANKFIKRKHYN